VDDTEHPAADFRSLGQRSPRVLSLFPDRNRALDTDVIVLAPRPLCRFTLDCRSVEPRPSRCIDAPVLLVSRLPFREAELLPDMVFADDRVVASEGVDNEAIRRARLNTDRK